MLVEIRFQLPTDASPSAGALRRALGGPDVPSTTEFRLVVDGGPDRIIEVCTRDRRGVDSWRPAKNVRASVEQILALALFRRLVDTRGTTWSPGKDGDETIDLGVVTL